MNLESKTGPSTVNKCEFRGNIKKDNLSKQFDPSVIVPNTDFAFKAGGAQFCYLISLMRAGTLMKVTLSSDDAEPKLTLEYPLGRVRTGYGQRKTFRVEVQQQMAKGDECHGLTVGRIEWTA